MDCKIDFYLQKHKLAIELDEFGHIDRNEDEDKDRQKAIEKEFGCEFLRINPDEDDYGVYVELSRVGNYIDKSKE